MTVDLEAVPKEIVDATDSKKHSCGKLVPAIELTEQKDGSLLVQYIAPFIEVQPPPLQRNPYQPNAWGGTHIRFGLASRPYDQFHDPNDPAILLWPNIPSNVGTVIFPKEFVDRLKNSPGFNGTAYVSVQHRDQFNIKRWLTGDGSFTYQFKKPKVVPGGSCRHKGKSWKH